MHSFWTNAAYRGGRILLRHVEEGRRCNHRVPMRPVLYAPCGDDRATHRSIHGAPMGEVRFDTVTEARGFLAENEGVDICGYDKWPYQFLAHRYPGTVAYDASMVRVANIDIETMADGGFPDIVEADKAVTLVTVRTNGETHTFGWKPYRGREGVTYHEYPDEAGMLAGFLRHWASDHPDIVTGWNIEFFDVPYLVNRINRVLGDGTAAALSPWGELVEREVESRGRKRQVFVPLGVSVLDYQRMYHKLAVMTRAADTPDDYKLNTVAHNEVKEKKIDYSEFESLHGLYLNDYDRYVDYNVHDVMLVERINDRRQLIELVIAMAYNAKVNYEDMLGSVKPWECIIHHTLLGQGIVVPRKVRNNGEVKELIGAYVKTPKPSGYDWVVSFDLNSLYPMLISQFNISPEQKLNERDRGALLRMVREERKRRGLPEIVRQDLQEGLV